MHNQAFNNAEDQRLQAETRNRKHNQAKAGKETEPEVRQWDNNTKLHAVQKRIQGKLNSENESPTIESHVMPHWPWFQESL